MSEIPDRIKEMLNEEEIENIENKDGWAFGNVRLKNKEGRVDNEFDDVVIELFNGEGIAGRFGGVKFMWADDSVEYNEPWEKQGYKEFYAHATENSLDQNGSLPGWYVEEYTDPEDADYGQASP